MKKLHYLRIISQYIFLGILLALPWILSLDYSIIYNLISLGIFVPLFKLFNQPTQLKVFETHFNENSIYIDFKKKLLRPKSKRKIIFYKWYLIWIPVYKKEYTFTSLENISDVIRECGYEYFDEKSRRNDIILDERLNEFKSKNNRIFL